MRGVIKYNNIWAIKRLAYVSVPAFILVAGLILNPVSISHDEASATTGTATASTTSLTIASGKNTASVAITPTNAGGAFATSSSANKAEFDISTNNYTGYTLAITASDDTGNLVNTSTNDTITSIATNLTESSFNTSTYNNKWGFKPSRYVSNNTVITNTGDGSVYLPSPTTTPTLLDKTNVANSTANNYTIALGIRADHNTYAGTYTKTFTLVATANPSTYTINYNKNTTDTVSNLPSTSTTGSTTSTSITLPGTVPTRAHYSFLGWCSTTTTTSNGIDSCSGTVYNPNGAGTNLTYGLDQTTANTTTLYAMWKIDTITINIATTNGASSISIDNTNYNNGATVSLVYGSTHTITGNYTSGYEFDSWATSGSISVASTSSASTTLTVTGAGTLTLNGKSSKLFFQNATSAQCGQTMYDDRGTDAYKNIAYSTASINGLCWMTRNLDLPGGTTLTPNDSNVTSDYTLPASSTDGFSTNNTAYVYNSGSTTCGDGSPCYSYYSYVAATAGTNPSSGEATSDICPKGWRLPTNAEYTALINTYTTGATLTAIPWNGAYAGMYVFSSFSNGGSWGYYWSSTASDSSYAYFMGFDSSSAATSAYGAKGFYGSSIRCVFEATNISEISTMQDFATNNATAIKDSMTAGQQYTLTDSRNGNKSYTVAKIGDLVWMTTNLDLPGGTTLTPADSNVTITHTISSSSTDGFSDTSIYYVYNSGSTTCGDGSPCYSYYSYPRWSYGDVCPKGWRLPTNAEYTALINTYTTGAALTASPFYGVYAGYYYNSSFYDGGSSGHYWTSTAYDNLAVNAYHLNFNSSSVNMHGSSVAYGFSVRCVAK